MSHHPNWTEKTKINQSLMFVIIRRMVATLKNEMATLKN